MRTIWFDMDGTIANLYGVENWLPKLQAHDVTPYVEAEVMLNMSQLARLLNSVQKLGYKLGIISNLVTSQEIPRWLKADNLEQYFGAVLLSCVEGIRKPDPAISNKACDILGVKPERCVYIGDNLNRDVEGTRLAGYGMFILYTTPEKLAKEKITDENRPDAVIFDFNELKEIFPKAPHVAWDKVRRV